VVAVWSSVAEFQALAIKFTANVLFPGTLWVALLLLTLRWFYLEIALFQGGPLFFATSIPLRQSVMLPSHLSCGGQPSLGHILWSSSPVGKIKIFYFYQILFWLADSKFST
jgi:hypothetical protein